jgi:hypothetical protein
MHFRRRPPKRRPLGRRRLQRKETVGREPIRVRVQRRSPVRQMTRRRHDRACRELEPTEGGWLLQQTLNQRKDR